MDGYTAVLCTAPGCGTGDPGTVADLLADTVGAAVRESGHGVLVSTGCLFGPAVCAARATAPVLVVQPCDAERAPTACALRIGPLRTTADVDAVGTWLRAGRLDAALLPAHLVVPSRRTSAAPHD